MLEQCTCSRWNMQESMDAFTLIPPSNSYAKKLMLKVHKVSKNSKHNWSIYGQKICFPLFDKISLLCLRD